MATGRTLQKWVQIYIRGYQLCGFTRSIGPLIWQYDIADLTTMCDGVRGGLPAHVKLGVGTLNGVMSADGDLHAILSGLSNSSSLITIPIGIRATPILGDPVYIGYFYNNGYESTDDGGASVVNIPFGDWDVANLIGYSKPWGNLLLAYGEIGSPTVNTSIGIDDRGAATTAGGYFVYHLIDSNGTITLKAQDAATNVEVPLLSIK